MDTKTYKYATKTMPMLLTIVFGVVMAAALANTAITNDRGLILNRLIEFSTNGASIFFALLSSIGVALAVVGVMGLTRGRRGDKKVMLSATSITAPKSAISAKIIEIPFCDVAKLTLQKIGRQEFVTIKGKTKKLVIYSSVLENKAQYADLVQELQRRCG